MRAFTIWLKNPAVTIFIGGDPAKGQVPVITGKLINPQIIVDPDKNTITIVDTS